MEKNKKVWYAYSDDELNSILKEIGRDNSNKIQRYKGLGEMDATAFLTISLNWSSFASTDGRSVFVAFLTFLLVYSVKAAVSASASRQMCIRDSFMGGFFQAAQAAIGGLGVATPTRFP